MASSIEPGNADVIIGEEIVHMPLTLDALMLPKGLEF